MDNNQYFNNQQNEQSELSKMNSQFVQPPLKKKKPLIIIFMITTIFVLIGGGVGTYLLLSGNLRQAEKAEEKKVHKKEIQPEFKAFKGTESDVNMKLKTKQKGVKTNYHKDAVVYVFEVKGEGRYGSTSLAFEGVTDNNAIVLPLSKAELMNTDVFKTNSCEDTKTEVKTGETKTICLVYGDTVNAILVPEVLKGNNSSLLYRRIQIDNDDSSAKGDEKKADEAFEAVNREGTVIATSNIAPVREAAGTSQKGVYLLPVSMTMKETVKYPKIGYDEVWMECTDGIFVKRAVDDTSSDGYMSYSAFLNKIGTELKKDEVIKYYIGFPKTESKPIKVYFLRHTGDETKTFYYNF